MTALQADIKKAISALTAENSAGDSKIALKAIRTQLKASANSITSFPRKQVLLAIKDLVHRVTALPSPQFDPLSSNFFDRLEPFMKGYLAFDRGGGATVTADVLASSAALNDWLTSWMLSANSLVDTLALPEVSKYPQFSFERKRGVIWVCDLVDSTKLLNDDTKVAEIELFLPRLHWLATRMVACAGARFVKWTGDGFLAWRPAELQRDVNSIAARLVEAACALSHLVIGTSLGAGPEGRFRLRHAVTLEQDTVLTTIDAGGVRSFDIIGRGVVLAFRLAGMEAEPARRVERKDDLHRRVDRILKFLSVSILTDIPISINPEMFHRRKITATECLKYFKGETFGTKSIWYYTGSASRKSQGVHNIINWIDENMARKSLFDFRPIHDALRNDVEWGPEVLQRNDAIADRATRTFKIAYKGLKRIQRVVADDGHPKKPHREEERP